LGKLVVGELTLGKKSRYRSEEMFLTFQDKK